MSMFSSPRPGEGRAVCSSIVADMRIAIIVDGLESTRQFHSDNGDAIRDACRKVRAGNASVEVEVFRDSQVDHLLEGLADSDISALFFASNSFRHSGGRVAQAVNRHRGDITEFLRAGRGLVVLHQFGDSIAPIELPNGVDIRFVPAGAGALAPIQAKSGASRDDPILNYPIDIDDLELELSSEGQLGDMVSWLAVDPEAMEGLDPVLVAANGDVLLGRSSDAFSWRVVVCALPLDWHRASSLLLNIAQFVTTGSPECIVWPSATGVESSPLAPALSQLGSTHVVGLESLRGPRTEWLLTRPALHLVNVEDESVPIPASFLTAARQGGVVLTARSLEGGDVTHFTGLIGSRRKELAQDFFSDLAADPNGVLESGDPFPLRNVVLAAQYFFESFPHLRNAWSPRQEAGFVRSLGALIQPGMTITSVLATVQTLTAAGAPPVHLKRAQSLVAELAPDDRGTRALTLACSVALDRASFDDLLAAIGEIPFSELNAPLAIRLLDWIGFLHLTLGKEATPARVGESVHRLIQSAETSESEGLWLSVEGTASVIFGVMAAITMSGDATLLSVTMRGLMRLRREYADHGSDAASLSTMARVAHALAVAERIAPLVVDRIAEAVPRATLHLNRDIAMADRKDEITQARVLSVRNRELHAQLTDARQSLQARTPIWLMGVVATWFVVCFVLAGIGILGAQIWRWPDLVPLLSAPLVFLWFWIAIRVVWRLERYEIVPGWLAKITRSFPTLAKKLTPDPGAGTVPAQSSPRT